MRRILIAFVAVLAVATLVKAAEPEKAEWDPRDAGPGEIDVSRYPEEMQRRYKIMTAKCQKCHPVARAVNSRFNTAQWKKYMKRMLRRPNSGINEEQAQQVYEFLKFYSAQLGITD